MQRLLRLCFWIFIGVLAYAPLHILLSTWLGTTFGVLPVAKAAEDVVMTIGAGLTLVVYLQRYGMASLRPRRLLVGLIAAYVLLTLLLALIRPTDHQAELIGLVLNLRFLVFFMYGVLLAQLVDRRELRRKSLIMVCASAFIVLVFGVVQYVALPNNALAHVGYERKNGVLPAFFIDDKPDLERIMSTQRDPNSLGSYVLIVLAIAGALWARGKQFRNLSRGFLLLSGLCLWFTFSRSAWIGAIIVLLMLIVLRPTARRWVTTHRKKFLIVGLVAGITIVGGLVAARHTYVVQNVLFHADKSTVLEDPNQLRLRFFRESVSKTIHQPLGSGPGTAGLASIHNTVQGGQLNEDYYLQIAVETGVLGIVLFVAILVCVARYVWVEVRRGDWLALAVLAGLAGLMFTNLLVHIWSSEAVAYTWWGLAAVVVSRSFSTVPGHKKVSQSA